MNYLTVGALRELLADRDPEDGVRVCLDLSNPDSVSFHEVREVNLEDGVELVVYEANDLFDTPPHLADFLLGRHPASSAV